jgi:hypothetical protein
MPGRVIQTLGFCAVLTLPVVAASAQTPPALPREDVTVTATKARELLDKFAKALTIQTKVTGKIARWETAICPSVIGQKPEFTRFITERLQAIAAAAGTPVNASPTCTANIQIIFTTTPQQLLDQVRKDDPDYLGYATTSDQREKLATVTRPVQAWYTTETIDVDGVHRMDSGRKLGNGVTMANFSAFAMPSSAGVNRDPIDLPYAFYTRTTGNHIDNGLRTSMLALTQLSSLDACQELPSIVNLMAKDCDQKIEGMTATDLAYLRGLYKMDGDKSYIFQQDEIADVMEGTVAGPSPSK